MVRLVCLANSERPGGQCIAGIDLATGEWIRPVPRDHDAVPTVRCIVGNQFLRVLDVFELDLATPKTAIRYQRENRFITSWDWRILGRFRKAGLLSYCSSIVPILHSGTDRVAPAVLERIPPSQWVSLQLVRPRALSFVHDKWDPHRWRAQFRDASGNSYSLKVTDADATRRLESGRKFSRDSILTVSLTKPWSPPDGSQPPRCYKLVAAVIE